MTAFRQSAGFFSENDAGSQKHEQRPHLFPFSSNDVPRDAIEQRDFGAHCTFEMPLKFRHIVCDWALDFIHFAHGTKVRPTSPCHGDLSLSKIPPMIHSMTGYGKSTATIGTRRYTAEIRSLNGKQLDLSVRMPSAFREKEMELRKALAKAIGRGKCDLSLHYVADGVERKALNAPLIAAYLEDLEAISKSRGYDNDEGSLMQVAMRLPDVLQQGKEELNPDEWKEIQQLIDAAMSNFLAFRVHEGSTLETDFRKHVANIAAMEEKIGPLLDERIKRIRSRIQTNFDEIQDRGRLDENRFEQEVLFYLEKLDVSEERVRLKAHCNYFIEVLEQPAGQAKKLGFIAQEIGREINTLGSKANDADMQRFVVQMKDELEKIKEQVLNAL